MEFKKGDIVEAIVEKDGSFYYYPGFIQEFDEETTREPYTIEFYNDMVNDGFYNKDGITKLGSTWEDEKMEVEVFSMSENKWKAAKIVRKRSSSKDINYVYFIEYEKGGRQITKDISLIRRPVVMEKKKGDEKEGAFSKGSRVKVKVGPDNSKYYLSGKFLSI